MDKEYLANPLNRRKKKYKYYLRYLENYFKNFLTYLILLPTIFPILFFNYFKKNKFIFKDFFNQNATVFIVSIFKQKKSTVFLFNLYDLHRVLSRFGIFYVLKNFSLYIGVNNNYKTVSFLDKNVDYYFNQDYFSYFDEKITESKSNFVLPFYHTKNFYINNKRNDYKKLTNSKKKFKIIFSGTTHDEWYGEFNFPNEKNEKFLNRQIILDIIKKKFPEKIKVINDMFQVNDIENTDKEILLIETNPDKIKRKKIFSEKKHLELISRSNFFLCMPGGSMPLCHHLIESCLVGTVPILSYNDYLNPKFSDKNALFFFNEEELISTIQNALTIDNDTYFMMQKNIINYYDEILSPSGVYRNICSKNFPLEIFTNFDHTSTRHRVNRLSKK